MWFSGDQLRRSQPISGFAKEPFIRQSAESCADCEKNWMVSGNNLAVRPLHLIERGSFSLYGVHPEQIHAIILREYRRVLDC